MPTTWQHIVDAAEAGILDETQWVELKAAIPPKSPAANLELARDLAALAVEGGLLIVGIKDSDGKAGEVCGTELAGLGDRIDQVSRDRIHPPLVVRPIEITDPDQAGSGCVLVLVDASSEAPHMVDGRYWGRGATGKRPLTDSDVRKILDLNARNRLSAADQVTNFVEDNPLSSSGCIYVLTPGAGALTPSAHLRRSPRPHRVGLRSCPGVSRVSQDLAQMFGPRSVGFRERRRQTAKTRWAATPSITRTPRAALFVTALLRPRALGGRSLRFHPMPALRRLGRRPYRSISA